MPVMSSSGILIINKPVGLTSFGVVARVRRIMRMRRVGHCGTLDPFAQGVLPVLIGRATGVARYMESYDKSYRVTVRFGSFTDTQDRTGQPFGGRPISATDVEVMRKDQFSAIRVAVSALVGERMQTPPMYSAVKVDGRPLYQYARQGIEVQRAARLIHVYRAEIAAIEWRDGHLEATIDIDCSKGTYIRTLCQDLGEATGLGAHAAELTRTACGPFCLQGAISLDHLQSVVEKMEDTGPGLTDRQLLLPMERALAQFPVIHCSAGDASRFVHGQPLAMPVSEQENLRTGSRVTLYGPRGFLGVGIARETEPGVLVVRAERVLVDREDC